MRLVVENLGAERGGEPVFSDLGFEVPSSQALIVTGPNGAGKSTLLRVVAGLLQPTSGKANLLDGGEEFPGLSGACHYLGHLNGMKSALTVAENLSFWQRFLGRSYLTVHQALERVQLATIDHLPFGYLSAGQKRRVAIARMLVSRRPVWLLDEPTTGLDSAARDRFTELLQDHLAGGGIVLAATHLPLGLPESRELAMQGAR